MARPYKRPEPKERRSKEEQLQEVLLALSTKPEQSQRDPSCRIRLASGFILRQRQQW